MRRGPNGRVTGGVDPVGDAARPVAPNLAGRDMPLVAYRLDRREGLRLVPAPVHRDWIAGTRNQFAKRCLPLLIANQAGWFVLNSHPLRVTWTGGDQLDDLRLEWLAGEPPYPAVSHFGYGILTWHLPFIFRTPPGVDLLARGPSNWPRDGISALEGIIETDWAQATFTMNWKVTRPDLPIRFDVGEPICMLVPQRRGELEAYRPEVRPIQDDPELEQGYRTWSESRQRHNRELRELGSEAAKRGWEKHYFRGAAPSGAQGPDHRTALRLREFYEPDGDSRRSAAGDRQPKIDI